VRLGAAFLTRRDPQILLVDFDAVGIALVEAQQELVQALLDPLLAQMGLV